MVGQISRALTVIHSTYRKANVMSYGLLIWVLARKRTHPMKMKQCYTEMTTARLVINPAPLRKQRVTSVIFTS